MSKKPASKRKPYAPPPGRGGGMPMKKKDMPMDKKDMGKDMPPWMRKDMPMMREEEKDKKPARKKPGRGKK